MNRRLRVAALLAVLAAGTAGGQPAFDVGEIPEGTGTLHGRLLRSDGTHGADLEVSLVAFQPSGTQGMGETRSGPDGSFRFEGIATDPQIAYFVVATGGGVRHSERVSFAEGENAVAVELQITETSPHMQRARRGGGFLRIESGCNSLRVAETHEFENPTGAVLFVSQAERSKYEPLLDILLPEGAGPVTAPLGVLPTGFERDGRALRFWGPLYPGKHPLQYSYPLDPGTARWEFPTGAGELRVTVESAGTTVGATGLRPAPPDEIGGGEQQTLLAGPFAPGEALTLSLEPAATPGRDNVRQAQLWLDIDDAALVVDEQIRFEAPESGTAGPVLCWALPDGASDLRFSREAFSLGLSRDPSGTLEVMGPMSPGEHGISVRYRLPAGDRVDFARRFGNAVPLLTVAVADTGVLVETTRLHRRRPVRSGGRSYLRLEGFQIAADEEVGFTFSRLPAARALPLPATAGFAIAAAAGILLYLGAPLRRPAAAPEGTDSHSEKLTAERRAIYAAIGDLDDDFDTDKLTGEDHARLRSNLKAQAVRLLAAERSRPTTPASANPAARCSDCGEVPPDRARFCPRCGTRLSART